MDLTVVENSINNQGGKKEHFIQTKLRSITQETDLQKL